MTEAVQIAIIVAIPATLAAVPGLIVSVRTLRTARATLHVSNGKLTALQEKLDVALTRIGALEQMLTHERGGRRHT